MHHYVPQCVLKNFSIDGKRRQICVFDKKKAISYVASIGDVGGENDFNTVTINGTKLNFEPVFGNLDGELARIAKRITTKCSLRALAPSDRALLSYLAVIQLFRSKIQRTSINAMARQLEDELDRRFSGMRAGLNLQMSEDEVKLMSLRLLNSAGDIYPELLKKDWALYLTDKETPFWTSDNPVVMSNVFPYGNLGLKAHGVEIVWPLSHECAISLRCPSITKRFELHSRSFAERMRNMPTELCTADNMLYYNSLQVIRSSRFIFGRDRNFDLANEIIERRPSLRNQESLFEIGEIGRIPQNENMPTGKWIVVHGNSTHYMLPIQDWSTNDGGWKVRIVRWNHEVDVMLQDRPHSLFYIFDDRIPRIMAREVRVIAGVEDRTLLISHADPAIDGIMNRMHLERSE